MNVKVTQQDSDVIRENEYFDAVRLKNHEPSFDGVKSFITQNKHRLSRRRRQKPMLKWQWMLAVVFPVLVVLACTKTEHAEPMGHAISFAAPENDAVRHELESVIGGLQTVVSAEGQKLGFLYYTCFISTQDNRSAEAVINQLKGVKGVAGLSALPVNAKVKESLLSRLSNKIFRTHIDATAMSDNEMQNTVMRQLKEKGFNNISVTVTRNEKGVRTLQLHPAEHAGNYLVDVTLDGKGTKIVLQKENKVSTDKSKSAGKLNAEFGRMTDAQIREYIRSEYGKQFRDEHINITRTAEEIAIDIKQSDKKIEIIRFRLN